MGAASTALLGAVRVDFGFGRGANVLFVTLLLLASAELMKWIILTL